jgi:hypothetical protein
MMSHVEAGVQVNGSPESGDAVPANGSNSADRERALRTAAATLELIRSGDQALRVLQLGSSETSLAHLCADHEVAAVEPGAGDIEPADEFDCAISVDRLWRLSGRERTAHLETLRSKARIVLVEAPLDDDSALEDAGRFFEEQGDWTATISEEQLAELDALNSLDRLEESDDAVAAFAQALEDLAQSTEFADRGVLVAAPEETVPGFDLEPLRPARTRGPADVLAPTLPLALEIQRANGRVDAAEQRSQSLELLLARREAQLRDISTKLADLSVIASDDRRARRLAEHELEVARGTRGYRLGHRVYRIRTSIRRGLGRVGRALISPLRLIKRKLGSRSSG